MAAKAGAAIVGASGSSASARVVSRVTRRTDSLRMGGADSGLVHVTRVASADAVSRNRTFIDRIIAVLPCRSVPAASDFSSHQSGDGEPAAVLEAARALLPWLVDIRRDLHRNPELGLEEHRTAARVAELLDQLGIAHRDGIAQTGVLGTIVGARPGPCVALRADIDALPLQDGKNVPYRSVVPGKMHACGHDAHTTILLGAARLLVERRDHIAGTIKLLFQPAEETVGGAKMMIEEG